MIGWPVEARNPTEGNTIGPPGREPLTEGKSGVSQSVVVATQRLYTSCLIIVQLRE